MSRRKHEQQKTAKRLRRLEPSRSAFEISREQRTLKNGQPGEGEERGREDIAMQEVNVEACFLLASVMLASRTAPIK